MSETTGGAPSRQKGAPKTIESADPTVTQQQLSGTYFEGDLRARWLHQNTEWMLQTGVTISVIPDLIWKLNLSFCFPPLLQPALENVVIEALRGTPLRSGNSS